MEHTIKAYLQRLPTAKLKDFLQRYNEKQLSEDFSYIIPYIRLELLHRETQAK